MKARYGECFHGGSVGDDLVESDTNGVTVTLDFRDGGDKAYELTWNKAAKLICEHIYDDDAEKIVDEDDEDEDDEEITNIAPIEKKEYMSENAKYAFTVHAQIVQGAQMVEDGLYLMAVGFKKMRDEKLYKELGYKSFEEYCENETGMARRNVYKYIQIVERLPQQFVTLKSQIGKEKLYLLSALSDEQRDEVVQSADLESTTVKELKAKIDELTKENEETQTELADRNERFLRAKMELEQVRKIKDEIAAEVGRLKSMGVTDTPEYKRIKERLTQATERNTELEREIKELENRPVEAVVTDSDMDEEIRNFYTTLYRSLEQALNDIYIFVRDHRDSIDDRTVRDLNRMSEKYNRRFLEDDDE